MKTLNSLILKALLIALLPTLPATAASGQSLATAAPPAAGPTPPLEGCDDGVVKDDGMPESGYGWVPSVVEGIYVQEFEINEIAQPVVDEVCICFLRSRDDDSIDFDVVFYADHDGSPADVPFADRHADANRGHRMPQSDSIVGNNSVTAENESFPPGLFIHPNTESAAH